MEILCIFPIPATGSEQDKPFTLCLLRQRQ